MTVAYHYCDLNAFISIIRNKKLWLSSVENMNDSREVRHFYEAFINNVRDLANDETFQILDEFLSSLSYQFPVPYICCFSLSGDILSQWRAYASDGFGVSIGFEFESFDFHPEGPFMGTHKGISIGAHKVKYQDSQEMQEEINLLIEMILSSSGRSDQIKFDIFNKVVHRVRHLSMFTKNKYFSEENEIRISHLPMLMTNHDGVHINAHSISDIMYRVVGNRISSYFELDFSKYKNPISQLILGPKCEVSEYELGLLLDAHGYNGIEVKRSGASYR